MGRKEKWKKEARKPRTLSGGEHKGSFLVLLRPGGSLGYLQKLPHVTKEERSEGKKMALWNSN